MKIWDILEFYEFFLYFFIVYIFSFKVIIGLIFIYRWYEIFRFEYIFF